MQSPLSNLYTSFIERVKLVAPEIRFISQDTGQLEFYESTPPVSFPCLLVDIADLQFEEHMNSMQIAQVEIKARLALLNHSNPSNLSPTQVRELALKDYELEHMLGNGLHRWTPPHDELGTLSRTSSATEKREDNIRVRVLTFSCAIQYDGTYIAPTELPIEFASSVPHPEEIDNENSIPQ